MIIKWIGGLIEKFRNAKIQADEIKESNSNAIRNIASACERGDCDTKQAQAVTEALESVSVNMTLRLKGDTDKTKKG